MEIGAAGMTLETLLFLRDLLCNQSVAVGTEGFKENIQIVVQALDELDAAIKEAQAASQEK